MKIPLILLTVALAAIPAIAQDTWEPYHFKDNERYEFKIVAPDDADPSKKKESAFILDIRKKGEDDYDVSWTTKAMMKKADLADKAMLGGVGAGVSPAWIAMNPLYMAFINQVKLKENDKTNIMGVGTIEIGTKETLGGRTGFPLKLKMDQNAKEVVVWEVTIDPELALPIKSVTYSDEGVEQFRMELTNYKKD